MKINFKRLTNSFCFLVLFGACGEAPVNQTSADRAGNPELREATAEFANTLPEISPGLMGNPEYIDNRGTHEGSGYDSSSNLSPSISVDPDPTSSNEKLYSAFDVKITCHKNGDYECDEIIYSINNTQLSYESGVRVGGNTHTVRLGELETSQYSLSVMGKSTTGKTSAIKTYNYFIYDSSSEVTYDPPPGHTIAS